MTKLHLLSLCLIGLATPVLADATPKAGPAPAPPSLQASAPDNTVSDDPAVSAPDDPSNDDPSNIVSDEPPPPPPPSGPPVASKDALQAFFDVCSDVSGPDPAAYDRASKAGWAPEDADDPGPFKRIYAGSRDFGGYGSVELSSLVESYPGEQLGYCRVDFSDDDTRINFKDMTGIGGLSGKIEDRGGGNVFGTWETADHKILVIGDRIDGVVEIEYNLLLGSKPAQN